MGLGDFKQTDKSSSTEQTDSDDEGKGPRNVKQGDKLPKSGSYVVEPWEEDKATYWHDGSMMKWEGNLRRKGRFFLRQYSDNGEYKGPDPDTHWVEDFPPEEERHPLWEDHTGDWRNAANIYIDHDCGGKAIIQYGDQAWARCSGCNTVLYKTEKTNRDFISDNDTETEDEDDEPEGGLAQFMGGA